MLSRAFLRTGQLAAGVALLWARVRAENTDTVAKGGAVRCPNGLRRRGRVREMLRKARLSGTKMVYATVIPPFV